MASGRIAGSAGGPAAIQPGGKRQSGSGGKLDQSGRSFLPLNEKGWTFSGENFFSQLPSMPFRAILPDRETIIRAALWKSRFAISYADGFAIETAFQHQAKLVTGDPELRHVEAARVVKLDWVGS